MEINSVKLSDIVSLFLKENNLPFYLKPNVSDPKIQSFRRTEWPKDFLCDEKTYIGFVSDRRSQVCWGAHGYKGLWINAKEPDFFEKLRGLLLRI